MRNSCRFPLAFLILLHGLCSKAQYYYSDTLAFDITTTQGQRDTLRNQLKEKGFSEMMIDGIISNVERTYKNRESIKGRTVIVRGDSSFIELNYAPGKGEVFVMTNKNLLVKNGRLFSQDPVSKEYIESKIEDSSRVFNSTGRYRMILGYECSEYKSLNHIYTVWITTKLPSAVNPGISHSNLPGAILGYEVNMGKATTRSGIVKIPERVI
jgi:hypothetical protein